MKKFFATILMISLFSVCAMAGGLKVTQGNKKVFKTINGNAALEIVLDNATYDDKMPLSEKFSDIANFKKIAINGFTEHFNEKSKTVKIAAGDTKYKITVNVKKVDQYFKVMGFIPGNATKMWGTITVADAATGEVLAVAEASEVDGGANPSPDGCISDCFEELGELVAKLK